MTIGMPFSYWAALGLIKSIQTATITIATSATTGTATISSVATSKTALFFNNWRSAELLLNPAEDFPSVTLTNATTVTATKNTGNASDTTIVSVTVVEFQPWVVTNIIYSSGTFTDTATQVDVTIASVNTARSICIYLGNRTNRTTYNTIRNSPTAFLQAATNVRLNRGSGSAGDSVIVSFCVIEFAVGVLASLQTAEITIAGSASTGTATISAVTTANTLLVYGGWRQAALGVVDVTLAPYVQLTNTTTLTATRNSATATTQSLIRVYVLEFISKWVKTESRNIVTIATLTASNTGAISVTNTNKTIVSYLGSTTTVNSTSDASFATMEYTNTTTVTATRGSAIAGTLTASWEAIEFV